MKRLRFELRWRVAAFRRWLMRRRYMVVAIGHPVRYFRTKEAADDYLRSIGL